MAGRERTLKMFFALAGLCLLLSCERAQADFKYVSGYCNPGWEQGNTVFVQCTISGEPDYGGWYITWATAWTIFACPFAVIGNAYNEFSSNYIMARADIWDLWSHLDPSVATYYEGYDDMGNYEVFDEDQGPCLCITADQYP